MSHTCLVRGTLCCLLLTLVAGLVVQGTADARTALRVRRRVVRRHPPKRSATELSFRPVIVERKDSDLSDPMSESYDDEAQVAQQRQQEERYYFLGCASIVVFGFVWSYRRSRRADRHSALLRRQARADGRDQPPSLYPLVDPLRCIGCGACTKTCHDKHVLGLIGGHAQLITPADCVGHGRCAAVCPVDAITLVFGTAKRPFELPRLDQRFQTTIPGVWVCGELGGMGLIANAFEQAVETVDHIADELRQSSPRGEDVLDVLIVGAGPAGLGAALRAQEKQLAYLCVDQEEWGGAIRSYPRAKIVMTRPLRVPLYGPAKAHDVTKEALLELFDDIVRQTGVRIASGTRVDDVRRGDDGLLVVQTNRGEQRARHVLLAIGRAGTPRKLGVPGEELMHVAYRMTEPEAWAGKTVVVAGGGDVACEVALALAEQPRTQVTLVHRGPSLSRPKTTNRQRVQQAVDQGRLRLLLDAQIRQITENAVQVVVGGGPQRSLRAAQVFVCIGGQPPTSFLENLGIEIVKLTGQPLSEAPVAQPRPIRPRPNQARPRIAV